MIARTYPADVRDWVTCRLQLSYNGGLGLGSKRNEGLPMLTDNILDLIGNTPLIQLNGENIYAKAEFLNPGGSIKDRVALAMLEGAERYFSTALL